jgi:hypothetical protein
MQFVECPHCGMKIIQSAKVCKSCQKPVDNAAPVELKSVSAENAPSVKRSAEAPAAGPAIAGYDAGRERPVKPAADAAAKKEKSLLNDAVKSEPAVTFDDLIEGGLDSGGDGDDASILEQIEVVREPKDDEENEDKIKLSRSVKGITHVNIIEKKEPGGIHSSNFQRNIVPRLIQIFVLIVLVAIIGTGIFIYKIMDLPQYYNIFHMRKENSKSFGEALIQLNVCENARANPTLGFQVSEIENSFLNSYVMWKAIVAKVDRITSDPLSKNTYMLTVKPDRTAKNFHFIRMYMNSKMAAKIKKKDFTLNEERPMAIHGRIIGWTRSSDRAYMEIEIYDAEITEGN